MTEKEKGLSSFEHLIQREISKAKVKLDKQVDKLMNAVADDGTMYHSEQEIQDAYGYGDISDSERRRLLRALEYREKRPWLKEDYYLSLCHKAQGLVDKIRFQDFQDEKAKEQKSLIYSIKRKGNAPRHCACCGVVIGEVQGGSQVCTEWHENHAECVQGHVCKACLASCQGLKNCKRNEEEI